MIYSSGKLPCSCCKSYSVNTKGDAHEKNSNNDNNNVNNNNNNKSLFV